MHKQRGITLTGAILGMIVLAFFGLFAAKLTPAYIDFFAVKKMLNAMEAQGDTKGTVRDIRVSFDRRNSIEGVQAVRGEDLEITKEGGEAVITANWSVRISMIYNLNACLDFTATTAK
ncbi:DUF4845 domain-containing protein [Usitatibacter palustris]|uniref:DUF4845 domain-containing protein n=1 Tax=Usitatibacter palustris TaxID=2732487 RepID=A0A6M4HA84_9PROT|nr:DUF4845 domain-containing protein [Usitatibacter palustris]QJR15304.1 hypothetical protein DSM104440_02123 [Usitatibacter palustris]